METRWKLGWKNRKKSDISLTYVYFSCNASYAMLSKAYAINSHSMFDSIS